MTKLFKTLILVAITAISTKSFANNLTPLMTAAQDGNKKEVQALLKSKADINAKDPEEKRTALYFAISNEHKDVIKLLIDKGADLENLSEGQESALFMATTTNNNDLMQTVLKKNKKLINVPDSEGTTPLMEAAKYGTKQTIEILLKAGAKKDLKNKLGSTALDIAKENKNEDAISALSKK
ncbi:Phosphocholine transferase AnkX [compost metagenome]